MYKLYYRPECPFCQKVLNFIEEKGIEVNLLDINEESNQQELMEKGGRQQVPFLVDETNDMSMYESDDIIEYINSKIAS